VFQLAAFEQVAGTGGISASPQPGEPASHSWRRNHSLEVGIGALPAPQQGNREAESRW